MWCWPIPRMNTLPPICQFEAERKLTLIKNYGKQYAGSLKKTKNRATIWSSYPTPEHIPRENHNSKRIYIPVFIAALFTIARTWKQSKCPSTGEWIKKVCVCVCVWWNITQPYKRKEIGSFAETWVDLELVIQTEVSQKEKSQYHILTHIRSDQGIM